MVLTGKNILKQIKNGNISIVPFNEKQLNPNSYNITLANELLVYDCDVLDAKKENKTKKIKITEEGFVLQPNTLYLGRTNEYTKTKKFVPCISGRSSVGRLGICVHITAGFGDVGFEGTWTLEITCVHPVKIYPNMQIGQIYYEKVQGKKTYYQGKYLGQIAPVASQIQKDFN
ncbi:MAG: dCTP deaminase [Clostridia bacterium]|nr:dCTP deaminase [Clostridia bacterium]